MSYTACSERYSQKMNYKYCGKSGLQLPMVSLGMWHNFGTDDDFTNMRNLCFTAFDNGITHFDLANNYGPIGGSAETNFGKIMHDDMKEYRDELVISTKAGYGMWSGPYGDGGSRKYLTASLDQSLKRMGLEYVDIFYHHRMDPNTPIEESMTALADLVKCGKALYAGISNYNTESTHQAVSILKNLNCPFIINQVSYSIFNRTIENNGLKDYAAKSNLGLIAFSPLSQGLLTNRYIVGIPDDSRIARSGHFLKADSLTEIRLNQIKELNNIAASRGQSLAQMALSWILRDGIVTSVLIGASKPEQILDNIASIKNTTFTKYELEKIDEVSK